MLRRQSRPRMRARPALGRRNPSSVRIRVDLPAPLGPSNPTAFPVPETPRRQVIPWRISRRPSLTFRFSSSTTGMVSKASHCCPTVARPRLSISIRSRINPEIRVRLAAWICSGVPSNTTRIGSRPAASSPSAGLGQRRQDSECPLRVQPGEGGRVESGRRGELAEELRRPDERGAAVPVAMARSATARSEAATM